ncbi:MAG: hypothetical protein PVG83_13845 [Acidimicrobiia bacterium]
MAVTVLAIAGFATFRTSEPTVDEIAAEAAAASIGHTAGAYAGLAFTQLGGDGDSAVIVATPAETEEPETESEEPTDSSSASEATGTIASPGSGWLSEVEVRAMVSRYFEPADVNRAVRIAWCESRFDPNAMDLRTGGVGLFNHLPRYWEERSTSAGFAGADATDAEASTAAAAWEVYNGGGWDVFNCR